MGKFSELWGAKRGNWKNHKPSQNPCMIWTNLINTPCCSFLLPKWTFSLEARILDLPCSREHLSYTFLLFGVVYSGKNPLPLPIEVPFSFSFIEHPWGFFMKVLILDPKPSPLPFLPLKYCFLVYKGKKSLCLFLISDVFMLWEWILIDYIDEFATIIWMLVICGWNPWTFDVSQLISWFECYRWNLLLRNIPKVI